MKQTKSTSLRESVTQVGIGFIVSFLGQLAIFPMFGMDVPMDKQVGIVLCFTALSLTRQYVIRRCYA